MTRRRRFTVVAAIAATVLATLGVVGGAQAAWRASDTVTGSATAGTTGVSLTGFNNITSTYSAGGNLSSVTTVTITNTGTVPLKSFATSTTIPANSTDIASNITVAFWQQPVGGTCTATIPSGVASYTWATVPAWLAGQGTLAVGASANYCVLSSVDPSYANAHPNQSFSPSLTVTASNQNWTTGGIQAAAFTLGTGAATSDPLSVTPVQIGLTPSTGTSVATGVSSSDGGQSALDPVSGVTTSPYVVCTVFTITNTTNAPNNWSFKLDTSVAPFNGAQLTQSNFAPSGYQTAIITNFPAAGSHVYTVSGLRQGNATTFGARYSQGAGPDGYSDYTWNTPLPVAPPSPAAAPTAAVHLCVSPPQSAPLATPGANSYSVATPKIAGCTDAANHSNPAQFPSLMSTPIPAYSISGNPTLCVYIAITGLSPHFYVGYTTSMVLDTVLKATPGLNANQISKIESANGSWGIFGYDGVTSGVGASQTGDANPTVTGTGTGTTFSWTKQGAVLPLAIASGQTVVIRGVYSVPAP